jgi:hypothetical protein
VWKKRLKTMIIRNPSCSRSGFSRRSFSAFLGGCGTRFPDQRPWSLFFTLPGV